MTRSTGLFVATTTAALAIALVLSIFVGGSSVQAVPQTPHTVFGSVFDGTETSTATLSSNGLVFQARILGVDYINSFDTGRNVKTDAGGTFGQVKNAHVCGNTTDIAGKQGGDLNEVIEFVVGGRPTIARDAFGNVIDPVLFVPGGSTFLKLYRDMTATAPAATLSSDACKIGTELSPTPRPVVTGPPPPFFDELTPTPTPLPAAADLPPDPRDVGDIFTKADPGDVADLLPDLVALDPEFTGGVFNTLDINVAAAILTRTETSTAARIAENLTASIMADIFERTTTTVAVAIMEQVKVPELELIIDEIEQPTLVRFLQQLTIEKPEQISVGVLLRNLKGVNPEVFIPARPPTLASPDVPDIVVFETGVIAYLRALVTRGWQIVANTPPPLTRVLANFRRPLTNVSLEVGPFAFDPLLFDETFRGQVFNSSFNISVINAEPEDVVAAHVTMFVDKSWLRANQVQKWSVQFNRLDEQTSTWVPSPAKRVRESASQVFYSVVVPGFSDIVVTGSTELPELVFVVSNLVPLPAEPTAGEEVTIGATVINTAPQAGVFPAELYLRELREGEDPPPFTIEAIQNISLEPGETRVFDFPPISKSVGTYEARIGQALGTFNVQAAPRPRRRLYEW